MKVFQSPSGDSFEQAFWNARAISTEHLETVSLIYCGVSVLIGSDTTLEQAQRRWRDMNHLQFNSLAAA